jgi:hypothetical protein
MRTKFRGKNEKDIDDELNIIIELFILLTNKIDFIVIIEKQMAERLIKEAYLSLNVEQNLIVKISKEVGRNYVRNMSSMISQLDISKKEIEEYNRLKSKSLPDDLKFKSLIISQNVWEINPKQYIIKMNLPPLLSSFANDF